MDPHAPRPDAKRHKDVSYLLEHYGGERVWVCTTGLATEDFPWPALTVPKPRHLFLPKEFHAPAYADSHVAVMLLGVGDTRRHSELRWFRYARAEHITAFSKAQFERWLPPFCARLVQAGARSGDPLVAADGLAAAFRMVDKFESRMVTCPLEPSAVHEARQLRLRFLDAARAAAEASAACALGSRDFLESLLSETRGGAEGFLAARNVSLEHVQYDFSSERALLGEESGLPQPSPTGVKSVLKNDDDDDDPARLMVAAACACAEQAERNRGATTHVTPFFSPTLLTDRGRYGTHVTGTMEVSESAALGRALAPFAPARGSTAPSGLSPLVSPSSAARAAARHFSSDGGVRPAVRLDGPAETRLCGPPARRTRESGSKREWLRVPTEQPHGATRPGERPGERPGDGVPSEDRGRGGRARRGVAAAAIAEGVAEGARRDPAATARRGGRG